ncbi:YveK family protein [Paenibacillus chitinolyticus]|uniref:YveK family protein n=1 Tax=Paenibacillus chitinolyticus TaxID=79263 RepID=UPI0038644CE0
MSIDFEIKRYLAVLRKRLWLILLIVAAGCLITGVVSKYYLKPVYQASTKLIVNSPADNQGMLRLDMNAINTNISLIHTYKEIIKTPAIMDLVVKEHPEYGVTSDDLMRRIQFSSVSDTQIFTLSLEDASYSKAAQMINTVAQMFQKQIPNIMKIDNVFVLHEADPAKTPAPVKPNVPLNVAISFLASLMFAIGLVFALEYFDDTLKTEEDVEHYLGLPTLVAVPEIRAGDMLPKRTPIGKKVGEASGVPIQ